MAVVEATHVKIQVGSRLEPPKSMTIGPWIQGHPILAIDQTDVQWTLVEACGAAPTDR
jgi:hypothetical protein